jgi:hypothetical protein
MNDREIRESLHDYVRGLLGDKEKKEIEAAIVSSASLKKELERVRAYYKALDEMEPVRASGDFLEKVHARIQAQTGLAGLVKKLFFPLHIKVPLEAVGVTATVLLVVLLYTPYVSQKQALENTKQQAAEENAPKPPAAATAEKQAPASLPAEKETARYSRAREPLKQFAEAKAKRSAKQEMHTQGFGGSGPEQAAPSVEAEPSAATGLAMADKSLKEPVAPAASPSAAPKAASDLAFSEKDEMRQARAEKAKGEAMPSASTIPEKEQGYAEEMPSKPAGADLGKAEKNLQQAPEILAQWTLHTSGGAPQLAQYEKSKKAEMKKSASGNYPAPAASPVPEMKTDRLMEKKDQEEFLKTIAAKYSAGLQAADSAGFRIYSITIPSKYLTPLLDSLRTHGDLTLSGSGLLKTSAEKVTVILKTSR